MKKKAVYVRLDEELLRALDIRSHQEGRSRADAIQEACRWYVERPEPGPRAEEHPAFPPGTPAFVGAWGELHDEEIDRFIEDVYAARERDAGRPVELEP